MVGPCMRRKAARLSGMISRVGAVALDEVEEVLAEVTLCLVSCVAVIGLSLQFSSALACCRSSDKLGGCSVEVVVDEVCGCACVKCDGLVTVIRRGTATVSLDSSKITKVSEGVLS